jgi:hypothetical protein
MGDGRNSQEENNEENTLYNRNSHAAFIPWMELKIN